MINTDNVKHKVSKIPQNSGNALKNRKIPQKHRKIPQKHRKSRKKIEKSRKTPKKSTNKSKNPAKTPTNPIKTSKIPQTNRQIPSKNQKTLKKIENSSEKKKKTPFKCTSNTPSVKLHSWFRLFSFRLIPSIHSLTNSVHYIPHSLLKSFFFFMSGILLFIKYIIVREIIFFW